MMRKMVCLALGHRFRLVQEFGPSQRRLKCERCGGDWGMHDGARVIVDWSPEFEQLYRDRGFKILEPLDEEATALAYNPLTFDELIRAGRWPGAFAMALGIIAGHTVEAAGFGLAVRFVASAAISWATMRLLMPQGYRRAYERKRTSLQA
jgi:hypothetical protein